MTEIRDARLRELQSRAEAAQSTFEAEQGKLFRSDGERLYAEAEHNERVSDLRATRNGVLREIEAEARETLMATREAIENVAHADPTELLSTEELDRVNAKRGFASDAATSLDVEGLEKRLRSVLAGGDRASIFAYWSAGQTRRGRILQRQRRRAASQRSADGSAPGSGTTSIGSTPLDQVLSEMGTALGANRSQEIEAARVKREEATQVQLLAGHLQQGVRNAGQAHFQKYYGDTAERIRRSQSLGEWKAL